MKRGKWISTIFWRSSVSLDIRTSLGKILWNTKEPSLPYYFTRSWEGGGKNKRFVFFHKVLKRSKTQSLVQNFPPIEILVATWHS